MNMTLMNFNKHHKPSRFSCISAVGISADNTMKKIIFLLGVLFCMSLQVNSEPEKKGAIGRLSEEGLPVIYKFINEFPAVEIRHDLTWLTVLSWKYDGSSNNGMPIDLDNQKMINLEDTIEEKIIHDKLLQHAYSRTGNNLKELVYYIHSKEKFLEAFNRALRDHSKYPIEINFYEDKEWKDFKKLLNKFPKKDHP
jgi:hypothetical protein